MATGAMAGVERKAAESVEDRFAAIDLDGQRIVRAVADDQIGPRIDRRVGDLGHVGEHLLVQSPVAGRDDDVGLPAQRAISSVKARRYSRSAQVMMIGGIPGRFIGGISGRVLCIGT